MVDRQAERLVRSLTSIFLDKELAADAAQDAFVQLYKHWDEAVEIAKDFEAEHPHVVPTDTAPPGPATTVSAVEVTVRSAELVETDAPAITNGRRLLVWVVKLGGTHPKGEIRATIYLDATTGEILTDLVY